jgi:putative addiction module component (TIGR02574 family)
MSSEARKLLKAALRLPDKERAAVAQSLIHGLDEGMTLDADVEWAKEIARRVEDVESGKTRLLPWSKVREKLYRKLKPPAHGRR